MNRIGNSFWIPKHTRGQHTQYGRRDCRRPTHQEKYALRRVQQRRLRNRSHHPLEKERLLDRPIKPARLRVDAVEPSLPTFLQQHRVDHNVWDHDVATHRRHQCVDMTLAHDVFVGERKVTLHEAMERWRVSRHSPQPEDARVGGDHASNILALLVLELVLDQ